MDVYIVLISTSMPNAEARVGPIYTSFREATAEVDRLQESNKWTRAWWIVRKLETR